MVEPAEVRLGRAFGVSAEIAPGLKPDVAHVTAPFGDGWIAELTYRAIGGRLVVRKLEVLPADPEEPFSEVHQRPVPGSGINTDVLRALHLGAIEKTVREWVRDTIEWRIEEGESQNDPAWISDLAETVGMRYDPEASMRNRRRQAENARERADELNIIVGPGRPTLSIEHFRQVAKSYLALAAELGTQEHETVPVDALRARLEIDLELDRTPGASTVRKWLKRCEVDRLLTEGGGRGKGGLRQPGVRLFAMRQTDRLFEDQRDQLVKEQSDEEPYDWPTVEVEER